MRPRQCRTANEWWERDPASVSPRMQDLPPQWSAAGRAPAQTPSLTHSFASCWRFTTKQGKKYINKLVFDLLVMLPPHSSVFQVKFQCFYSKFCFPKPDTKLLLPWQQHSLYGGRETCTVLRGASLCQRTLGLMNPSHMRSQPAVQPGGSAQVY